MPDHTPPDDLIETLRRTVGAQQVLTEGDLSAYEQDWRRRMQGKARAVVRACAAAGAPIVPQGGNTGLSVGSTPDTSGREVVLSLSRMNAVRALDPDNLTLTVEKVGIERDIFEFAHRRPWTYGVLCVLLAAFMGYGASRLFRRT